MTPEEIRSKRADISGRRIQLNKELNKLALESKILRLECDHSDAFKTSHMGENCKDCPDCGSCL